MKTVAVQAGKAIKYTYTHTLKHRINNLLDVVQATGVRLENRCMVKHLIKCNAQENNI